MDKQYYSQNEEEKYILEAFGDKADGTLLDVGAYDGKAFSNTLRLIERGWSGVMAEPSPGPFHSLLNLHKANEKVHLINAAVVPAVTEPLIKLHVTDDAVSTTDDAFSKIWAQIGYRPIYISPVSVIDTVKMYHSLVGCQQPDFVNVDTEGTTYDIAVALEKLLNPRVWCVEYVVGCRSFESEFRQLFPNYRVTYRSGENLVFVRV